MVSSFVAALVIGVCAVLAIRLTRDGQTRVVEEPVAELHLPPPEDPLPAALTALETFFEAPDLLSKAALVHDSERVTPMMEDYHGARRHPFPTLGRIHSTDFANFNGTPMVLFEVEPFDGLRYPVAVVWDGKRFVVDWESLTAYGTMEWVEFTESRPQEPHTFRIFLLESRASDSPAGMPEGYSCFRIEHRDLMETLVTIAPPELSAVLQPMVEGQRVPMTLEIAWRTPDSGVPEIPEIVRFIASGWSQ